RDEAEYLKIPSVQTEHIAKSLSRYHRGSMLRRKVEVLDRVPIFIDDPYLRMAKDQLLVGFESFHARSDIPRSDSVIVCGPAEILTSGVFRREVEVSGHSEIRCIAKVSYPCITSCEPAAYLFSSIDGGIVADD